MQDYNLDDGVSESFKFSLAGHIYVMRYPTTEEIAEAQKIGDDDADARTKWLYGFVTPENSDDPGIEEALKKANIKVVRNFNAMIEKEFAVGE
jgi:hypothetical protein